MLTKRVQTEGRDPPWKEVSQAVTLSRQGVPEGTKVKLQKTKFSLDLYKDSQLLNLIMGHKAHKCIPIEILLLCINKYIMVYQCLEIGEWGI